MYDLKQQVVLITGAANGIGAEVAKQLAHLEVKHVRILDVDDKKGVLLQNELNKKYGENKVKFIQCDISVDEELFGAFQGVIDEFGSIDAVFNNAGIGNESNAEWIQKEININLKAVVNSTIKAIDLMSKAKGGKGGTVVNISSIAALIKLSPGLFVYGGTKSGVLHFSNCIGDHSYYSKTGVRVIAICYGATETEIIGKAFSFDEDIKTKDMVALFKMQSPEVAARGTIEAFMKGETGSTWIVNNGKPAKDITDAMDKTYSDLAKLLID